MSKTSCWVTGLSTKNLDLDSPELVEDAVPGHGSFDKKTRSS